MSPALILLVIICFGMAMIAFVSPERLLQYPVAVGLLMLAFILPQAYAIERLHMADAFSPQYSWVYFTICMLMTYAGFALGRRKAAGPSPRDGHRKPVARFNSNRLAIACIGMSLLGGYSYYQMSQLADTGDYGSQWTGVITFYYLLSGLLVMSLALSWLTFLHTRNRLLLAVAIVSLIIFLPTLTVSIKRSWIFEVAVVIIGGLVFVRGYRPDRLSIAAVLVAGTLLIHQVGALRSYVQEHDTTIVAAIRAGALTENVAILSMQKAPEVQGGVTSIAISRALGIYEPFVFTWNRVMQQYFPAFIFGKEAKSAVKIHSVLEDEIRSSYFWEGSTSTGFADSFMGFWWLGSFIFFAIAYVFGRYWSRAISGDLQAQFLYLVILNDGLVAITESISRFISSLPFIFVIAFIVFRFARSTRLEIAREDRRARARAAAQAMRAANRDAGFPAR